jgi:predicted Zn-dependent peptidase
VVGDVDPEAVIAAARRAFAAGARSPGARAASPSAAPPAAATGERQVFTFLPGDVAAVAVGFPGVPIGHPDRAGLDVLAEVLAARLGAKLRLEQRLVHRASAMSIEGALGGFVAVEIACRADRTAAAVAALRAEIDRLGAAGPAAGELVSAVRALRLREGASSPALQASALASDEALATAAASAGRRAALARLRLPDLAGLAARTFAWDAAVIATAMPRRASPEAARRTRGSVRRPVSRRSRR